MKAIWNIDHIGEAITLGVNGRCNFEKRTI